MGLKEKMMENMMNQMSAEEKKLMMNTVMEKLFANMSEEEKKQMMEDMMPKMMQTMTGKGGSGDFQPPMMGMKEFMMSGGENKKGSGSAEETSFNPMDMCTKMIASIECSGDLAALATPEIQTLFEEWATQVGEEILQLVKGTELQELPEMAKKLKISLKSLIYFLARLAQKEKIDLLVRERTKKE